MEIHSFRTPGLGDQTSGAVERFVPDVFTHGVPEQLDRTAPVLVACAGGRRASIAASQLVIDGFTDVRVLTGAGIPDLALGLA